MKDKNLYQRRTDGDYKRYTEDSFYFNSTEKLWCWKQTSTEKIFKAKTINDLKKIKETNFICKGIYEHKNDSSLEKGNYIPPKKEEIKAEEPEYVDVYRGNEQHD